MVVVIIIGLLAASHRAAGRQQGRRSPGHQGQGGHPGPGDRSDRIPSRQLRLSLHRRWPAVALLSSRTIRRSLTGTGRTFSSFPRIRGAVITNTSTRERTASPMTCTRWAPMVSRAATVHHWQLESQQLAGAVRRARRRRACRRPRLATRRLHAARDPGRRHDHRDPDRGNAVVDQLRRQGHAARDREQAAAVTAWTTPATRRSCRPGISASSSASMDTSS